MSSTWGASKIFCPVSIQIFETEGYCFSKVNNIQSKTKRFFFLSERQVYWRSVELFISLFTSIISFYKLIYRVAVRAEAKQRICAFIWDHQTVVGYDPLHVNRVSKNVKIATSMAPLFEPRVVDADHLSRAYRSSLRMHNCRGTMSSIPFALWIHGF